MYQHIAKIILIAASLLLVLIIARRMIINFGLPKIGGKIRFPVLPRIPKIKGLFKNRTKNKEQIKLPFNDEALKRTRAQADRFFGAKKFKDAESLYLGLVQKTPFDGQIYSRLGIIYLAQKQYGDACQALEKSIQLGEKIPARYFNLAIARLKLNESAKAKEAIKKALELDPGNEKYKNFLAEMLEK